MGQKSTIDSKKKKKKGSQKSPKVGLKPTATLRLNWHGQLHCYLLQNFREGDWLWTTPNDRRGQAWGQRDMESSPGILIV